MYTFERYRPTQVGYR